MPRHLIYAISNTITHHQHTDQQSTSAITDTSLPLGHVLRTIYRLYQGLRNGIANILQLYQNKSFHGVGLIYNHLYRQSSPRYTSSRLTYKDFSFVSEVAR